MQAKVGKTEKKQDSECWFPTKSEFAHWTKLKIVEKKVNYLILHSPSWKPKCGMWFISAFVCLSLSQSNCSSVNISFAPESHTFHPGDNNKNIMYFDNFENSYSVLHSAKRSPANVRRLNNRKWRQRYCLVGECMPALALLNSAQNHTSKPISTKFAQKQPWVKGSQV